jgi:pyruvate/2-oxoglutarate dehydrogenase complex dihydrolipoamide dehydrogenase (E3) component
MDHVRRTRQRVYEEADAPSDIEKLGVEVIAGNARFEDPHTIEIQETSGVSRRPTSRFFIIATGNRPRTGNFAEPQLTNETIFDLERQPKRLVIMGAGPGGIEMAQAFQRLGSEVMVVASGQRILPRDDPEHAGQLQECLSREGVSFLFGQKVTQMERCENAWPRCSTTGARSAGLCCNFQEITGMGLARYQFLVLTLPARTIYQ